MAGVSKILTDEHHVQIQQGLLQIEELEREIGLAKQAGIDMSHAEQVVQQQKSLLARLKNVYFPNGM